MTELHVSQALALALRKEAERNDVTISQLIWLMLEAIGATDEALASRKARDLYLVEKETA